jgi:hypothetical protein
MIFLILIGRGRTSRPLCFCACNPLTSTLGGRAMLEAAPDLGHPGVTRITLLLA